MNDCKVFGSVTCFNSPLIILSYLSERFEISTGLQLLSNYVSYAVLFWLLIGLTSPINAELKSMSDQALSEVDGAGVGLVMDDFVFSHGHDLANDKIFRITGLTDQSGAPVTLNVEQLYIARAGSNYGSVLNPVNLGRLSNPFEIDLLNGDDVGLDGKAVLQLSAPTKVDVADGYDCLDAAAVQGSGTCSSRPSSVDWENGERADIGLELQVNVGVEAPRHLNFHAESAVFDGSYVRLWGDDSAGKMAAEFRVNFYTPELEISTCTKLDEACGSAVKMKGFAFELALGNSFQPLYIGADSLSGGLTLELAQITHQYMSNIVPETGLSDGSANGDAAYAFFQDYYSNPEYRSNIAMTDLEIGGVSLGSARVEGMLIQHLDVKLRDLEP